MLRPHPAISEGESRVERDRAFYLLDRRLAVARPRQLSRLIVAFDGRFRHARQQRVNRSRIEWAIWFQPQINRNRQNARVSTYFPINIDRIFIDLEILAGVNGQIVGSSLQISESERPIRVGDNGKPGRIGALDFNLDNKALLRLRRQVNTPLNHMLPACAGRIELAAALRAGRDGSYQAQKRNRFQQVQALRLSSGLTEKERHCLAPCQILIGLKGAQNKEQAPAETIQK